MHKKCFITTSAASAAFLYFAAAFFVCMQSESLIFDECSISRSALDIIARIKGGASADWSWPLMYKPYIGALKIYWMLPWMLMFGPGRVWALRIGSLFLALGSLWCMRFVLGRWFCRTIADMTVLLLAVDTFFIRSSALALFREELLVNAFFWAGLACVEKARHTRPRIFWSLAGLAFGLGLWAKLMFLGYLLGMGAAALCLFRPAREFLKTEFLSDRRRALFCPLAFLLGAAPLIYANLTRAVSSAGLFAESLSPHTRWNNFAILANMKTRFFDLLHLLQGRIAPYETDRSALTLIADWPQAALFFAALLFALHYLARGREIADIPKTPLAFLLITYTVIWAGTCYIPSEYTATHVLILLPMAKLLIAAFLLRLWPFAGRKTAAVVLVGLSTFVQVENMAAFRKAYAGGAMHEYSLPLQARAGEVIRKEKPELVIDLTDMTGLFWSWLSGTEEKKIRSYFEYCSATENAAAIEESIKNFLDQYLSPGARTLMLVKTPQHSKLFPNLQPLFTQELRRRGYETKKIETVRGYRNRPCFSILRVKAKQTQSR